MPSVCSLNYKTFLIVPVATKQYPAANKRKKNKFSIIKQYYMIFPPPSLKYRKFDSLNLKINTSFIFYHIVLQLSVYLILNHYVVCFLSHISCISATIVYQLMLIWPTHLKVIFYIWHFSYNISVYSSSFLLHFD